MGPTSRNCGQDLMVGHSRVLLLHRLPDFVLEQEVGRSGSLWHVGVSDLLDLLFLDFSIGQDRCLALSGRSDRCRGLRKGLLLLLLNNPHIGHMCGIELGHRWRRESAVGCGPKVRDDLAKVVCNVCTFAHSIRHGAELAHELRLR